MLDSRSVLSSSPSSGYLLLFSDAETIVHVPDIVGGCLPEEPELQIPGEHQEDQSSGAPSKIGQWDLNVFVPNFAS